MCGWQGADLEPKIGLPSTTCNYCVLARFGYTENVLGAEKQKTSNKSQLCVLARFNTKTSWMQRTQSE